MTRSTLFSYSSMAERPAVNRLVLVRVQVGERMRLVSVARVMPIERLGVIKPLVGSSPTASAREFFKSFDEFLEK